MMIQERIKRMKVFFQLQEWDMAAIADKSGLPRSTVEQMKNKNWNPRLTTLQKLDVIVPDDFGDLKK